MVQVSRRDWGTHKGKDVSLFTVAGEGLIFTVSNYGGVLQSFITRDARDEPLDIVLGYDSLEDYLAGRHYFGAMIGPIADRMAQGRCTLAGQTVQLPKNAGPDSMHSGPDGFHSQVWDWEILPDGVKFYLCFPEGSLLFPGVMQASLVYRVPRLNTLRLEYRAACSMETALSFTNHSYFNLEGVRRDCLDHSLQVISDNYAETTCGPAPLVTGRFPEVAGTPLDFRADARVGDAVGQSWHREIAAAGGIDHYYKVKGSGFRNAAKLSCEHSGLRLVCRTDAGGVLVYTGNGLSKMNGKSGTEYGKHWGVCLETGELPNAVNLPKHRASVLLSPGEEYRRAAEFIVEQMELG